MSDTIPGKIVRQVIADILIERSNAIDDACNAMIEKEMNEIGVISEYTGELGWTACGTRVLADDILDGRMSLEEAIEVLSSEERREAKARCQKWLDEKRSSKILAYDCDGEEVEEFRILRYPFSA